MKQSIKIKKGVRQGCVLSPSLFNRYSEEIFKKALRDETAGIKINGLPINNIRYADDTVLIAESIDDLQRILNKIIGVSEEYGLMLNIDKTKFMIITKKPAVHANLYAKNKLIERVL